MSRFSKIVASAAVPFVFFFLVQYFAPFRPIRSWFNHHEYLALLIVCGSLVPFGYHAFKGIVSPVLVKRPVRLPESRY